MSDTDIIIIGGGIPGLLQALLAAQDGLEVILIEKQSCPARPLKELDTSGRTSALLNDSVTLLEQAGILTDIQDYTAPLETLHIVNNETTSDFHAREIGLERFSINIPNHILQQALINKLHELTNARIMDGTGIWDFEANETFITVRLEDDNEVTGKLLIGADGRNSPTRNIAGIDAVKVNYKQTAITCLIHHSRAHRNIFTEYHESGGPFTLVPLPGNTSSVVWCENDDDADSYMAMKKQDFEQALQDKTRNILGGITLATAPQSFKLRGLVARHLTAPRTALIAEAAHALHPIGAQGMNLSLRDVKALHILLTRYHKLGLDIGSKDLLQNYKRKRKRDIWTRFGAVSALKTATSQSSLLAQALQQSGLNFLTRRSFFRKKLMRLGMAS